MTLDAAAKNSIPGDEGTLADVLRRVVTKPLAVEGYVGDGPSLKVGNGGVLVVDAAGRAFLLPFQYARRYDDVGGLKDLLKPHHVESLLSLVMDEEARRAEKPRDEWDARDAHVYGPGSHYTRYEAIRSLCRDAYAAARPALEINDGEPYWRVEYRGGLDDPMLGRAKEELKNASADSNTFPLPWARETEDTWIPGRHWRKLHYSAPLIGRSESGVTGLSATTATGLKCNRCGVAVSLNRPGKPGRVLCIEHRSGFMATPFAGVENDNKLEHAYVDLEPVWAGEGALGEPEEGHEERERMKSPEERALHALSDKWAGSGIEVSEARVLGDDTDEGDNDSAMRLDSEGVERKTRDLAEAARRAAEEAE
jgi:hypothetical protein